MKATGIVRRMDELGRVVIPKEIRRTLRIREGDPLEIFTDRDELMLKKYSPIATIEKFSESAAKTLAELSVHFMQNFYLARGERFRTFVIQVG